MKLTRIEDQSEIGAAYRSVFSLVTRGTNPQKAVVGYHSGNVSCRVAWNSQYGLWVMYTPKDWDNHLLVFGTQNPRTHRHGSLNITCQINVSESSWGRQRAGAVLSNGTTTYLAHNGGIAGGKEGVGKAAFLSWYRDHISDTVDVADAKDNLTPYIVIGKIAQPATFLPALARFIFAVERFKRELDASETVDQHLKRDAEHADSEGEFEPGNTTENQDRVLRAINLRRGQPDFRRKLLKAYGGRCALSGCNCQDALEAAHIRRYGGLETNHIQNGLLLRCDLHTLFDLGRIGIDPKSSTVVIADTLLNTVYAKLKGKKLRLPINPANHPNPEVLREHLRTWKLRA
jgi:hypothetical protein